MSTTNEPLQVDQLSMCFAHDLKSSPLSCIPIGNSTYSIPHLSHIFNLFLFLWGRGVEGERVHDTSRGPRRLNLGCKSTFQNHWAMGMKSGTKDHTYTNALCMKYRKSITNMATWRNFYVITSKLKEERNCTSVSSSQNQINRNTTIIMAIVTVVVSEQQHLVYSASEL
jgi:hypothetical protein